MTPLERHLIKLQSSLVLLLDDCAIMCTTVGVKCRSDQPLSMFDYLVGKGIAKAEGEAWGAAVERLAGTAREAGADAFDFVVPMKHHKNCDFSFSGLKSSLRRTVDKLKDEYGEDGELPVEIQARLALGFQNAATAHVEDRIGKGVSHFLIILRLDIHQPIRITFLIGRAMRWCKIHRNDVTKVVLCGGAASNSYIRERVGLLTDQHDFTM